MVPAGPCGGFGGAGGGGGGGRTRTSSRRSSAGSAEFDDLLADLLGQQGGFSGAPTRGPEKGGDLAATARVSLAQALGGTEVSVPVADPSRLVIMLARSQLSRGGA